MLTFLISVFLVGALLASMALRNACSRGALWNAFMILFGGFSGLLSTSAVISTFNIVSVPELTSSIIFLPICAAVAGICFLLLMRNTLKFARRDWRRPARQMLPKLPFFFLTIVFGYLASASYLAIQSPMFGWDVLDHWGPVAIDFYNATQHPNLDDWRVTYSVHPSTVSILLGLFSSVQLGALQSAATSVPWLMAYGLIIFAAGVHAYRVGQNINLAFIISMAAAAMPLLIQHVAIFGYAEIFLSALLASGAVALTSLESTSGRFVICVFIGLLTCTLKNTGFIYGVIFCASAVLAYTIPRNRQKPVAMFLAVVAFGILTIMAGTDQSHVYFIGGREFDLRLSWIKNVPENIMYSAFINISFGIVPAIGAGIALSSWNLIKKEDRAFVFILLLFLGLFSFSVVSQLTSWGAAYATPGSDTGNSRFSLPMMVILHLSVPYLYSLAIKDAWRGVTNKKVNI